MYFATYEQLASEQTLVQGGGSLVPRRFTLLRREGLVTIDNFLGIAHHHTTLAHAQY